MVWKYLLLYLLGYRSVNDIYWKAQLLSDDLIFMIEINFVPNSRHCYTCIVVNKFIIYFVELKELLSHIVDSLD